MEIKANVSFDLMMHEAVSEYNGYFCYHHVKNFACFESERNGVFTCLSVMNGVEIDLDGITVRNYVPATKIKFPIT